MLMAKMAIFMFLGSTSDVAITLVFSDSVYSVRIRNRATASSLAGELTIEVVFD